MDIIDISSGSSHSLALDNKGKIYSWGNGQGGRLGHDQEVGENSPRQITNVLNDLFIKYINAGDASSSCVTHDRIVYMWGSGLHGRLGNGNSNNLLKPELSQELKDKQVKLMFKGTNTSFALLESKSILAWGSSKNGKLGFSMGNGKNYELPKEIITINE